MNGVLQVLVYPLLNRFMGSDQLGELLYLMGLVAILCPSVGQALNTSRLVVRRDYEVKNGDYNILLLLFGGAGTAVTLMVGKNSMTSVSVIFWTVLLLMTMIFRYYGDVEYRLNLDYRNYFNYYAVLTVGYVAGFGLYFLTKNWFLVFVTGEVAALVYLATTGTVFHGFFKRSRWFGTAFQRGGFLVISYLITDAEYRPSCSGTSDRASGGNTVLCDVPDRKNTGTSGSSGEYDHHFLSYPEPGADGKKAVFAVYRNRCRRQPCVFYRLSDWNTAVCMAVLQGSL